MSRDPRRPRLASLTALWLTIAAILGQTAWFDRTSSVTYDETFYANCAINVVQTGSIDHRLAEYGVAPLPVLICYGPPACLLGGQSERDPFRGNASHCQVVSAARTINALLSGVGLVVLVYVWLWRRRGPVAAAVGAALLGTSPALLSHASLATTDALFVLCGVLSLAVLIWFRADRRSPLRFLLLAASIGLAFSMKYSGVFLLPVAAIAFGFDVLMKAGERRGLSPTWRVALVWGRDLLLAAGELALLGYCAFLFAWAFHGFAFSRPLEHLIWPVPQSQLAWLQELGQTSVPTPLAGLLAQVRHNEAGHPAFLLGERATTGWRSYYPWTLVLKSTPLEMLLALGLPFAGLLAAIRRGKAGSWLDSTRQVWLCAAAVYLALLVSSRIDIGHRYTLLLYPLLILAGVDALWPVGDRRSGPRVVLAGCLVAAQLVTSFCAGPDKLSYFTPFIGGPKQGYHYLVDSNVDWGQDLPRLKNELERLGHQRVLLAYFGTARPEAYGIKATPWGTASTTELERFDVLAISVTTLQGTYAGNRDPFAPLRELEPTSRAGNSILLYELRDERTREALKRCRERERPAP